MERYPDKARFGSFSFSNLIFAGILASSHLSKGLKTLFFSRLLTASLRKYSLVGFQETHGVFESIHGSNLHFKS